MKKWQHVILFTALILNLGCYKRVSEVDPDFIGYWRSGEKTVSINAGRQSLYENREGVRYETYSGWAKIKDDKLKIGFKKLSIDRFPELTSETTLLGDTVQFYTMVLEGDEYIRN